MQAKHILLVIFPAFISNSVFVVMTKLKYLCDNLEILLLGLELKIGEKALVYIYGHFLKM